MFLKNYTSDVPTSETIRRIEQVLIKCGVLGIEKEYRNDGTVMALTFRIRLEGMPDWVVRLPADVEKAQQALWLNYADGDTLTQDGKRLQYNARKSKIKDDFREQAERTAWKIMQDWVEVQMSMIQMKQAEFTQVFLPYRWDGKRTFYDMIKTNGFRAMLPEKCETE